MRTLTDYHNKHVLISGQGATEEIGRMYVYLNTLKEMTFFFVYTIGLVLKILQRLKKFVQHFRN